MKEKGTIISDFGDEDESIYEKVTVGEYAGYIEVDRKTFFKAIENRTSDNAVQEVINDGSVHPTRYYIK